MKSLREALAALVLIGGIWGVRMYFVTHPKFQTQAVDLPSARAYYPGRWPKAFASSTSILFENRRPDEPARPGWDATRWVMNLEDRGVEPKSVEAVVASIRQGREKEGRVDDDQLANEVRVKTFELANGPTGTTEQAMWMVFQGKNGHYYSANWDIPKDWVTRHRYEYFYRSILGSLEFQPDPKK